jgi:hypothetical protein
MPAGGAKTKSSAGGTETAARGTDNKALTPMTDEDVARYEEALKNGSITLNVNGENTQFTVSLDSPNGIKALKEKLGVAPEAIISSMLGNGLQKALQIRGPASGRIIFTDDALEIRIRGQSGNQIARTFHYQNKTVNHDLFTVGAAMQGSGLAKRMMENAYNTYTKMGIKAINVHAALDGGGYAWAKFGFKPDNNVGWQGYAITRLHYLKNAGIPESKINELRTVIKSKDSKSLWRVSDDSTPVKLWHNDTTIGKVLLRGASWNGTLNLQDKESVDRMWKYIRGGKKSG